MDDEARGVEDQEEPADSPDTPDASSQAPDAADTNGGESSGDESMQAWLDRVSVPSGAPEEPAEGEPVPEEPASDDEAVEPAPEEGVAPDEQPAEGETAPEDESAAQARRSLGAKLPFWLYTLAWAVFSGVMAYRMWPAAADPYVDGRMYMYFVAGGLGMLAIGPMVGAVVFAVVRSRAEREHRAGLLTAVFVRTAGAMAVGALLWWAGLLALEWQRTGRLFGPLG